MKISRTLHFFRYSKLPLLSSRSLLSTGVMTLFSVWKSKTNNWDLKSIFDKLDDFERNMSFVSEPAYPGVRGRAVALKRQQMGGHWNTFAPSASSS